MDRFEYKYICTTFFSRTVLRQVEVYEREGWSLYSLAPTQFFIFGCGGTAGGMQAVMRRPLAQETGTRGA